MWAAGASLEDEDEWAEAAAAGAALEANLKQVAWL